jgi:hypothetical protein
MLTCTPSSTVTTQALATATQIVTSIATSVITSTATVPTATVTTTLLSNGEGGETYPVTDYVIAPAVPGSSLSRRDGAEFCGLYLAQCDTECKKVGTVSRTRVCKIQNELEGQYSLSCICRNRRVRTQTALLAMAKDVKVVEVLSTATATNTATTTSTSTAQVETVVTTTLYATTTLSQGTATSTTIYALAPTGRLVAKDASTDARLGTVNGNGLPGIDSTDSQYMFVRDGPSGLYAFSDLAGNFLVGEQNKDAANFAPNSADYALLNLGPSSQTGPQQPSGVGQGNQQGYETYIYNVHPLAAGGLEITPVWTQSTGRYAKTSWLTLLKEGTFYYLFASPGTSSSLPATSRAPTDTAPQTLPPSAVPTPTRTERRPRTSASSSRPPTKRWFPSGVRRPSLLAAPASLHRLSFSVTPWH